jgi:hypothetical protein
MVQHKAANRRYIASEKKDNKPSVGTKSDSEDNTNKPSVDSKIFTCADDEHVQTSQNEMSPSVQSEQGSKTDQSGISCQRDSVCGAESDLAQEGVGSSGAIMDDPSDRWAGAINKLLDVDEDAGKLAHVRFRDTTEDINACLEPKGEEVKVGSVESGIAEMEEDDKEKSESSPPPLTPHMQIGNIMYFQYGSVDNEGGEGHEGAAGASEGKAESETKKIPIKPFPKEKDEMDEADVAEKDKTSGSGQINKDAEQYDESGKLKRSEPIPAPLKKPAGNVGKGSFSPLNFSPNFCSFVDFSSGLFSTNKDDRARVKDISDVSMIDPPQELTSSLEGSLDNTQVTQTGEFESVNQKGLLLILCCALFSSGWCFVNTECCRKNVRSNLLRVRRTKLHSGVSHQFG